MAYYYDQDMEREINIENIIASDQDNKLHSYEQFENEPNKVFPGEYDIAAARETLRGLKNRQTIEITDQGCLSNMNCFRPRALQEISQQQMIELRQRNILNDYAYETKTDTVYMKKIKSFIRDRIRIIDPDSLFYIYWQIFNCFIVVFYLFEIPFLLSFKLSSQSYTDMDDFTYCCIGIFIVDILICFNTAYYNQGQIDMDRGQIVKHYLKTYFLLDLIPICALIIQLQYKTDTIWSYLQILFFLKFYEITKSTQKFQEYLQLFRSYLAFYRLFEVFMMIIWLCHVFGCVFHKVAIDYVKINCWDKNISNEDCRSWITQTDKFKETSYQDSSTVVKYTYTFYWAVMTMISVGYGDITPQNFGEVIITICTMFVSCMIFAYSINAIWEVIRESTENKQKFQKYVTAINRFMKDHEVNRKLQHRVQAYFAHLWETEKKRDEELEIKMIQKLAPGLKEELLLATYGEIFNNFMKRLFSKPFLKELASSVEEVNYSQGEVIFTNDQFGDNSLYYVAQGSVEIYVHGKKNIQLNTIYAGHSFGQIAFVTGLDRTASARCLSYTRVYRLKRASFLQVLNNFEADKEVYYQLKDQVIFNDNYNNLYLRCWICEDSGHICMNCPKVHVIINKEDLIQENNTLLNQRNMLFQRSTKRVPFNALCQARKIQKQGNVIQQYHKKRIQRGYSSDEDEEYSSDVEEYEDELNDIRKLISQQNNEEKFDSIVNQRQTAEFKQTEVRNQRSLVRRGSVQVRSFQEKKKKKIQKQQSYAADSDDFSPLPTPTSQIKKLKTVDEFMLDKSKTETVITPDRKSSKELITTNLLRKIKRAETVNPNPTDHMAGLLNEIKSYLLQKSPPSIGVENSNVELKQEPNSELECSEFSIDKMQNFSKYYENQNPQQVLKRYRHQQIVQLRQPNRRTIQISEFP